MTERLSGNVALKFSAGPVQIPVYGSVVDQVQSVPEKIVLLVGSEKPVKRRVMLSGSELIKVLSAELVNAVGEVSFKELRADRCSLFRSLIFVRELFFSS